MQCQLLVRAVVGRRFLLFIIDRNRIHLEHKLRYAAELARSNVCMILNAILTWLQVYQRGAFFAVRIAASADAHLLVASQLVVVLRWGRDVVVETAGGPSAQHRRRGLVDAQVVLPCSGYSTHVPLLLVVVGGARNEFALRRVDATSWRSSAGLNGHGSSWRFGTTYIKYHIFTWLWVCFRRSYRVLVMTVVAAGHRMEMMMVESLSMRAERRLMSSVRARSKSLSTHRNQCASWSRIVDLLLLHRLDDHVICRFAIRTSATTVLASVAIQVLVLVESWRRWRERLSVVLMSLMSTWKTEHQVRVDRWSVVMMLVMLVVIDIANVHVIADWSWDREGVGVLCETLRIRVAKVSLTFILALSFVLHLPRLGFSLAVISFIWCIVLIFLFLFLIGFLFVLCSLSWTYLNVLNVLRVKFSRWLLFMIHANFVRSWNLRRIDEFFNLLSFIETWNFVWVLHVRTQDFPASSAWLAESCIFCSIFLMTSHVLLVLAHVNTQVLRRVVREVSASLLSQQFCILFILVRN